MTDPTHAARLRLGQSLRRRVPTYEVATDILFLLAGDQLKADSKLYKRLAKLSKDRPWWSSFGDDDFDRVDPADTQLKTFHKLFPLRTTVDPFNVDGLRGLATRAREWLGAVEFDNAADALINFREISPRSGMSRDGLRKRLRFLRRFEEKIARVEDGLSLRQAQMAAKSRLAYQINTTQVDDLTLAFVSYLTARSNRRSVFMVGSQSRAKDKIVEGLFELMEENRGTNWFQVALVMPTPKVMSHLTQEELGILIGRSHLVMSSCADHLSVLFEQLPERMRDEMVMVKGVDSSRWNAYAGALNTIRSMWINAVLASTMAPILDSYLPGKAPRLMASDLVWWYRNSGEPLHADTRMFAAVPRPWDVIHGEASLGREEILAIAKQFGDVDAEKTGWVGPRAPEKAERPEAEPALVHGIIVTDPLLAKSLRRCGVFSGKKLKHLADLPDAITRKEEKKKGRITPIVS